MKVRTVSFPARCNFPQTSISKCTTNLQWVLLSQTHTNTRQHQACEESEHVEGCSGDDAQHLLHGPLSPQELPQLRELGMLCQHLLVCTRTTQTTTADKLEAQRPLQTQINSPELPLLGQELSMFSRALLPSNHLALTNFKGNKRCSSSNFSSHLEARSTVLKIASWKPCWRRRIWHFWNEIFVTQRLCIAFRHAQIICLS